MLQKTRGILLQRINYSETSIIIRVFTEHFGLQSFILKGIRSQRSKTKTGLLQHLALLEIEVDYHHNQSLHHIREIRPVIQLNSIPFDLHKSSVILFLNEILIKCLKEEQTDRNLFDFIFNSIRIFDLQINGNSMFHLIFLMKLSMHLGFLPQGNFSETNIYFNLKEGAFSCRSEENNSIGLPYSRYLYLLMEYSYEDSYKILIPNEYKLKLINYILDYYSQHIPLFGSIKSHKILHDIFNYKFDKTISE